MKVALSRASDTSTEVPRAACGKMGSFSLTLVLIDHGVCILVNFLLRCGSNVVLIHVTGAFFARDEGNIFNCQLCGLSWCLSCDIPFHQGETCEEHNAGERVAAEQRDPDEERERRLSVQRLWTGAGRASQRSIQRDLEEERERQRSIQRRRAEDEQR